MTKPTKKRPPAIMPVAPVAPPAQVKKVARTLRIDESLAPDDAARISGDPIVSATRIIAKAEEHTFIGKAAAGNYGGLSADLYEAIERIDSNDLRDLERMLFGQAAALQSLFVRLTEGALAADNLPNYDLKFRYALRAQAQCRATLETLAAIKNPPVVFARQANVAHGPQQVNNGLARAGDDSPQNELSGEAIELRQNGGTPAATVAANQSLVPVGAIDGPTHASGKGQVISKRVERRKPSRASRVGKGAYGASEEP
jgi:hypothetical protein